MLKSAGERSDMAIAMFNDQRPWYRMRLRFIVPLAIGICGSASPIYWAMTAKPAPSVDYAAQVVELSAAAQPPGENGWPLMVAMAQRARRPSPVEGLDVVQYAVVRLERRSADKASKVLTAVEWLDEQGAFELLHDLARCPRTVPPADAAGDAPYFHAVTQAVATVIRARAASMYVSMARGDPADAVAALEDCLGGARALSFLAIGTAATATVSSLSAVCHNLEAVVADFFPDRATLQRFLDALRGLELGDQDLAVLGDQLLLRDMVQRSFAGDENGNGRLLPAYVRDPSPGPIDRLRNLGTLGHARRQATVDALDRYFELALGYAHMDLATRRRQGMMTQHYGDSLDPSLETLRKCLPYWVDGTVAQRDILMCKIARLQVLIGLHIYTLQSQRAPAALDDLVPATLPSLPGHLCFDFDRLHFAVVDGPDGVRCVLFDPGRNNLPEDGAGDDIVYNPPTGAGAASLRRLAVGGD